MTRLSVRARGRWSVAFRVLAGTLGSYAFTSLTTVILSLLMARIGMNRAEAVTAATLVSFIIFAVVAMVAFHARNAVRASGWWLVLSLPLALAAFLLTPGLPA
ncbi:hypothetical protein WSK_4277 [Novosphingobium sp. Rr 2-17]|uniref:hypothetical protein n=1 Tax=Novosphingobium sp. Rr 2-17 TaxID=555793 RepID=UPI0002697BE0|nr:hypothetical protein [Novosphingobium sp. Rr 2-17]EIZ77138.1 hypothetical protein WSK_4277 [Novosphingobium sp. Rr 2-17]